MTGRRSVGRFAARLIATSLVVVMAVDPMGLSALAPGLAAAHASDGTESSGLSRSERVDEVAARLGLEESVEATELAGSWAPPVAGTVTLTPPPVLPVEDEEVVTMPTGMQDEAEANVGGMPVTLKQSDADNAPEAVKVRVAGEAEAQDAGVSGVLVTLTDASDVPNADRSVDLTVSFAEFANAGGAGWASRLRAVWIPDCDPAASGCAPIPLPSVSDLEDRTISVTTPINIVESEVSSLSAASATSGSLALTAGASGPAGNWSATSLSPSSTWGSGGSTGAFTWSLPLSVPTAASGPTPDLSIGYSSAVSDGRTPSSNNQSGPIGEGFDITSGFVERSYVPCVQDIEGAANNIDTPSGDLCWGTENATLSFNGSAIELIRDATTGQWRGKNDDGSRIEHLTGAWNGGQAGEYWKVTTTDGTQYFFGRGQRSATDTTALNSAWTVPVYGNHPGEPCYQGIGSSGYSASKCSQVWRWNLEYVTDTSGNSMTYFYTPETNSYIYDIFGNPTGDIAAYISGGRLDRIEYGTRAGSETAASAPARVTFATTPRCITNLADPSSFCDAAQSATTANHWPDTPVDLICADSASCTNITPVFFDRNRLSTITTSTFDGTAYQPIDTWRFHQRFVAQGTGIGLEYATGAMLVTDSITRTGHNGTNTAVDDLTLPSNTFQYTFLENRVDSATDDAPALWRPRMTNVRTESGASVSVNYRTECAAGDMPGTSETDQQANTRLCYPVKWSPNDDGTMVVHYFHKYVVDTLVEDAAPVVDGQDELITGSVSQLTTYTYSGGAAWAKPTGAMVKESEMTYSDFRGFAEVTTTLGTTDESVVVRNTYFRGLGGSLTAGPTGHKVSTTDRLANRGQVFAAVEMNGTTPVTETINVPGAPVVLATNSKGVTATRIPTSTAYGFTYDASGDIAFRTKTTTTNDENSQPVSIEDLGDVTTADDDTCTTIAYAHSTNSALAAKHLISLPAHTETVAKACGATVSRPDDVISATNATYDSAGRPIRSESLDPDDGTGYVLDQEVLSYDTYGRPLTIVNAAQQTSTYSYTHSAGGLMQSVATSTPDPDGAGPLTPFTSTTTFNPLTGMVVSTTDLNGRVTTGNYDALGRLLKAWYPQHAGSPVPSVQYDYVVQANGLNSIVTKTLGADGVTQHASSTIYDGLLRPFQTQIEGTDAGADHDATASERGRMVAHTYYDSLGRVMKQTGEWRAQGTPQGTPIVPLPVPPSQTTVEYDGAGRTTAEIFWVGTDSNPEYEKWRTTTSYDGATVIQVPPLGATPQAATTDARGRILELREYIRDADDATQAVTVADVLALPYQSTTYEYNAAGDRVAMRDHEDNLWSYDYDWAGREISATDPDSGTTSTTYDVLGRIATTTNGNGQMLAYTYDALGRTTSLRDGSGTGNIRIAWRYDQATGPGGAPVLGQVSSATRYSDGNAYTTTIPRYDAANRPLATTLTLPDTAEFAALASRSFTTEYSYTSDGQVASMLLPAVASADGTYRLGAENVTTRYDTASMPSWMSGGFGWGTYVAESRFTADGRPLIADLGNTYGAIVSYRYEDGTKRLENISLDRERFDGTDLDVTYSYDAGGNITSIKDQPTAPGRSGIQFQDNQCFNYDGLRRLTEAWTSQAGDCAEPTAPTVGGSAPYWTEYSYDALGNRTEMIEHAVGASAERVTTYSHGEGTAGPHSLTGVTESRSGNTDHLELSYDLAGNRSTAFGQSQGTEHDREYSWDAEGMLVTADDLSDGAQEDYVYDASGNRLIRTDTAGTTVYLPGGQEVLINGDSITAARYYSFAGTTVATRTGAGLGEVFSLVTDHHGSTLAAVPNTTWTETSVQRLHSDPFGATRAESTGDVPGDHRFLGAVRDAGTGLTLLGARYYDAVTGVFISPDPLLDPANTAQFNAYVYSGNNPITWADPSGLSWWSDFTKTVTKGFKAVGKALTTAAKSVVSFVDTYKAEIVGGLVGAAAFIGCSAMTIGVGVVGCAIAAGAAGAAVTSLMKSAETGKFTPQGLITDIVIGGTVGALTAGVGVVLGPILKSVATTAVGSTVSAVRTAVSTVVSRTQPAMSSALSRAPQAATSIAQRAPKPGSGSTQATRCSFAGATLVLLADGTQKPIDQIKIGDSVLASDPETGRQEAKPVQQVFVHEDVVFDLSVGSETIVTTEDHPFWSVDESRFKRADELEVGDHVLSGDDTSLAVSGVMPGSERVALAYNLAVADIHTYHVGFKSVLVHNTCAVGPGNASGVSFRSNTAHIFRDAPGHLAEDTPANRALIQSAVAPANLRATTTLKDGSTLSRYYELRPDGTQAWAEVRGTEITNGGLNAVPR
ncbi:polymorphic toxin-type HINT domain-containing protein [Salinibacterium sp. SYSU T00001]|uniref:RHS repeat-associated core domain-containing protein n=1 Tax=Homoserinimonas sedimenticola TaxID=2986805 RepID=UPI002235B888|nr:RHS repeat-associated core domain-containing protein [Salinibacterium sedimenticola]MCW4384189.1 polymorphic toxin-type HINT domain-containing protein [Salinibacterium sedimenticola]